MAHKYGGPWSEVKLDAVEYYLRCFTGALSPKGFDLWYIDAFAGSGDREATVPKGGLFTDEPFRMETVTLDGSARRALKIDPPFNHYVFIEQDTKRHSSLLSVEAEFPDVDIKIRKAEANSALLRILGKEPWTNPGKARGVVFLDPFSTEVDFTTLQAIAGTKALDVWYLFNIGAAARLLARDLAAASTNETLLDRMLSPKWREIYEVRPEGRLVFQSLFDETDVEIITPAGGLRRMSRRDLNHWFKGILESVFPYVSEPLPLMTGPRGNTLTLFHAISNGSTPAVALAKKFAKAVIKKYSR